MKITKINENNLNRITEWMYEWWGKDEMHTFEQVKEFVKYSLQEKRLPQTYGAFINDEIVGMYQFSSLMKIYLLDLIYIHGLQTYM